MPEARPTAVELHKLVSGAYMGSLGDVESAAAAEVLPSDRHGALATVNGISDMISSVLVGALWVACLPQPWGSSS